jgi:hypothetical protein
MRRRLLFSLGLLVLLGALGLSFLVLLWPRPGISKANFERLRMGMGLEEVVQLLGGPADDYTSTKTKDLLLLYSPSHGVVIPPGAKIWEGDEGGDYEFIWVVVDEQGRVQDKGYDSIRLRPVSVLERVRSWFGL